MSIVSYFFLHSIPALRVPPSNPPSNHCVPPGNDYIPAHLGSHMLRILDRHQPHTASRRVNQTALPALQLSKVSQSLFHCDEDHWHATSLPVRNSESKDHRSTKNQLKIPRRQILLAVKLIIKSDPFCSQLLPLQRTNLWVWASSTRLDRSCSAAGNQGIHRRRRRQGLGCMALT